MWCWSPMVLTLEALLLRKDDSAVPPGELSPGQRAAGGGGGGGGGGCGGAVPFHSGGSNFRRSAPILTFIEFSSKLSDLPSTRRRSPVVASTHTMEVTSPCAPQPMIETSDCQGACSSATRLARLTLSVTI